MMYVLNKVSKKSILKSDQITYSFVTALTSAVLFFLTHSEPEKNLPEAQEINMA